MSGIIIDSFTLFSVDADAQAFLAVTTGLTQSQETAINDLVVGLKANNTWDKYLAIYPVIGGTEYNHKYNLKDPRDLDAAFRLSYIGFGVTHSATGMNGHNTGGATSFLNISTEFASPNIFSAGYYSRTTNANTASVEIGASVGAERMHLVIGFNSSTNAEFDCYDESSTRVTGANGTEAGWFVGSRLSTTDAKLFKDGSQIGSTTTTMSASPPNANLSVMGSNTAGYSSRECAFVVIGDGLSATEIANDYTTIQAYQTALGREI